MSKPFTMPQALRYLARHGIKTTEDLDAFARRIERKDADGSRYIPSRYQALVLLVGENAAISIMHELATKQCCLPPKEDKQ